MLGRFHTPEDLWNDPQYKSEILAAYKERYNKLPKNYEFEMHGLWAEYTQWFDGSSPDPRRRYAFVPWLRHVHSYTFIWKF